MNCSSGEIFAVKKRALNGPNNMDEETIENIEVRVSCHFPNYIIQKELNLLKNINHKHIVRYLGHERTPEAF